MRLKQNVRVYLDNFTNLVQGYTAWTRTFGYNVVQKQRQRAAKEHMETSELGQEGR